MAFRLRLLGALLLIGAAQPQKPDPKVGDLLDAARVRLDQNDFTGALALSDRALRVAPRDPAALLLAGNLVRDRYGLTAALPWYDRVLQLQPDNIDALIDKAATLGDTGQTVAMLAVTRQVLALDPRQPMALFLQSTLAARAAKWDLALGLLYRTGGALDDLPAVMLLRGAIAVQTGANEVAIAALNPLVQLQPNNRHARRLLGLALWRSDDDQGALDTLQPIADDGDTWVLMVMARASETLGDRARSVVLLDRASVRPQRPALQEAGTYLQNANTRFTQATAFRLIDALSRSGQDEKAGAVMTTLIIQNPASLPALRLAANDALARGEWTRAATALESVRNRVGDTDAIMLGNLAWARFNLGYGAQARVLARKAYDLAPANAFNAANYAQFLSRTSRRSTIPPR